MIDGRLREVTGSGPNAGDGGVDTAEYVTFERTHLMFKDDTPIEVWQAVLLKLRDAERSVQWWVGDALAYGEAHYGEEAFAELERRDKTLANWATVARGVEPSRRREGVAFSHHAEVASLRDRPESQEKILKRVETEDLTVGQTRELVQQEHQERAEGDPARNGRKPQTEKTYEYCAECHAPESAWGRRPSSATSMEGAARA